MSSMDYLCDWSGALFEGLGLGTLLFRMTDLANLRGRSQHSHLRATNVPPIDGGKTAPAVPGFDVLPAFPPHPLLIRLRIWAKGAWLVYMSGEVGAVHMCKW